MKKRVLRVKNNDKQRTLRQYGTFNPRPQDVTHPLFQDSEFFDADDLVQMKYEMLRQVRVDKRSVSQTAKEFGFSRPSFYQAEFTFEQSGLSGLLPGKRGPRSGHKLTPEVMKFVAEQQTAQPSLSFTQLAEAVKQNFNLQVHPRSIERQLLREKKAAEHVVPLHSRAIGSRWIGRRIRRAQTPVPERAARTRVDAIHTTRHA